MKNGQTFSHDWYHFLGKVPHAATVHRPLAGVCNWCGAASHKSFTDPMPAAIERSSRIELHQTAI